MKYLLAPLVAIDKWIIFRIFQPFFVFLQPIANGKNCFWFAKVLLYLFYWLFVAWHIGRIAEAYYFGATIDIAYACAFPVFAFLVMTTFKEYQEAIDEHERLSDVMHFGRSGFVRLISILAACSFAWRFFKHDAITEFEFYGKTSMAFVLYLSACAIGCKPAPKCIESETDQ